MIKRLGVDFKRGVPVSVLVEYTNLPASEVMRLFGPQKLGISTEEGEFEAWRFDLGGGYRIVVERKEKERR